MYTQEHLKPVFDLDDREFIRRDPNQERMIIGKINTNIPIVSTKANIARSIDKEQAKAKVEMRKKLRLLNIRDER